MYLYDTRTASLSQLDITAPSISLYVCGITPYDSAHLGHAFTYHTFDVLTRRLHSLGREVRSVRNVTDVDDDILRVAAERNRDYRELAESEVSSFERDMAAIDISPVSAMPRATEFVPQVAEWVAGLEDIGVAYAVDGWVFFDVGRFPAYGSLCGWDYDTMVQRSRERGANPDDPRKRSPLDFVLWQLSAAGEPSWPSRWGEGRPGWHIECTVMASTVLGPPIDIHGGGDDLIFPHHESETAQYEAMHSDPFVRHWVHVAMVQCRGEKMSKSVGNLIFVRDLLTIVSGATIRLLLAAHHHRSAWSYDDSALRTAEARRQRYHEAISAEGKVDAQAAADYLHAFHERIDDDLDTAGALGVLDLAAERLMESPADAAAEGIEAVGVLGPMLKILGAQSIDQAPARPLEAAAQLGCS